MSQKIPPCQLPFSIKRTLRSFFYVHFHICVTSHCHSRTGQTVPSLKSTSADTVLYSLSGNTTTELKIYRKTDFVTFWILPEPPNIQHQLQRYLGFLQWILDVISRTHIVIYRSIWWLLKKLTPKTDQICLWVLWKIITSVSLEPNFKLIPLI